ncbi:Yip1 family protein [Pseudidiomarina terrestris]|uniref:YIP1 family protein n=1 Tax=Pseudidiomarina terrestris TaxID=2820060 RepID=A0AAW7QY63_9GAMM|nr:MULTISPECIES: Yip1 family protein [unclassified Pseudidiomarina]MDN7124679.1 YIP1 family protein [Pseudidiomarina sp. 1APP75-32.1]MDN7126773.1 YIP1 family protein [Pseudidiomarina sp. 1APR75-33.1]MDN7129030.1 YIP1 family protein [Pseudidiomarina sp. 1APR75-15]MDN7134707.1 YIP1 family protein [Pseudidiomarina sp. 1ASP75-5]MDN7136624.1 YIP1 family protein [Pseudidiomarina sp. 1ASP75-14]
MILNHIWGLYAHPREEWKSIDARHESMTFALSHILIVALIPCAAAYYASAVLGWSIGAREETYLTQSSAITMAVAMYVGIIVAAFALAYLIHWMAKTFGAAPTFTQSMELAAYTATPAIMSGVAALYPELWFVTMAFLAGVAYSVYLLYSGVPILMHIPEERGFIYASSVVTAGLIMLVVLMVTSAMVWTNGFMPQFM